MPHDKNQPTSEHVQCANSATSSKYDEFRGKDTFFSKFNKNGSEGARQRKQTRRRNYNSLSETSGVRKPKNHLTNYRYLIYLIPCKHLDFRIDRLVII